MLLHIRSLFHGSQFHQLVLPTGESYDDDYDDDEEEEEEEEEEEDEEEEEEEEVALWNATDRANSSYLTENKLCPL